MSKTHRKEQGQALVLLILAIVAIFGFAALAVDVGRLYAERRRAQNAADAAAYAAAFTSTQGGNYLTVAIASTQTNGYNDTDPGANAGARTDVQIYHPPINGKYSVPTETINPYEYYQVIITSDVDKAFSQFVYNGPLQVTVEAIARGRGQRAFAAGNSIVATCATCCDALSFHGSADIYVDGGNIVSLSVAQGCDSGTREGQPCIEVVDGSINLGGSMDEGFPTCRDEDHNVVPGIQGPVNEGSGDLWGAQDPGTPGCAGLPTVTRGSYVNVGSVGNPFVLTPGIYTNGISISGRNSVVRLERGMYCLDQDLDVQAGSLVGADVMFVMRGSSSVKIVTSDPVTLSAPAHPYEIQDDTIYPGYKWFGFLIYMPYSNNGLINLAGGNTSNYTGTVYAPGPTRNANTYKCSVLGNSDELGLNASIICYTIDVGGTGSIDIYYRDDNNAQSPPMIELSK